VYDHKQKRQMMKIPQRASDGRINTHVGWNNLELIRQSSSLL